MNRVVLVTGAAAGSVARCAGVSSSRAIPCSRSTSTWPRSMRLPPRWAQTELRRSWPIWRTPRLCRQRSRRRSSCAGRSTCWWPTRAAPKSPTLAATDIASWQRDVNLNLNGTFYTVEAVRASMIERQQGVLVLIGSVNGMASLGHPAYSAAKAGLISYTKALALELGKYGIRANIVCPGTVKTKAWQARVDKNPQVFENLKKYYPLRDFATPDDIADAVSVSRFADGARDYRRGVAGRRRPDGR